MVPLIGLGKSSVAVSDQHEVRIRKTQVVRIVDASFIFPREDSMKDHEIAEARKSMTVEYSCVENGTCSLGPAIEAIMKSAELKGLGVRCLSHEIAVTIEQHPEVFPSRELGGYVIQATGKPFLLIKNNTCRVPNPRYGFVDLTEVKKKLLFEAMREKEDFVELSIVVASAAIIGSSAFMKLLSLNIITNRGAQIVIRDDEGIHFPEIVPD